MGSDEGRGKAKRDQEEKRREFRLLIKFWAQAQTHLLIAEKKNQSATWVEKFRTRFKKGDCPDFAEAELSSSMEHAKSKAGTNRTGGGKNTGARGAKRTNSAPGRSCREDPLGRDA